MADESSGGRGTGEQSAYPSLYYTLASAPVVAVDHLSTGTRCTQATFRVQLEGGVAAFWKRGDSSAPGEVGVRREVAAYELAHILGWDDLLPIVAERRVLGPRGDSVLVASIEYLGNRQDNVAVSAFTRNDIDRAAGFDALILNNDRGGHNWCGITSSSSPAIRLKLYDHELAFVTTNQVNSSFFNEVGGQLAPTTIAGIAGRLAAVESSQRLSALHPSDEYEALKVRARALAATTP